MEEPLTTPPASVDELRRIRCVGCEGIGSHLDEAAAAGFAALVPEWERDGVRSISREFRFGNFRDAFGFATRLALVAEEQGHHPDLEIGWGRCLVTLTTHALGGLTSNDFIVAAQADRLVAATGARD